MKESAVEGRLVRAIHAAGGVTHKLAPTTKGIPDRIAVLGGMTWLIEVKTAEGRATPLQRHRMAELAQAGARVAVVYGPQGVDAWADWIDWQLLKPSALPTYRVENFR